MSIREPFYPTEDVNESYEYSDAVALTESIPSDLYLVDNSPMIGAKNLTRDTIFFICFIASAALFFAFI